METSKLIKPISDFGHASNVMDDALKRYEQSVQKQNDERVQQRQTLFQKIDIMNNAIQDKEAARQAKAKELGSTLESQVKNDIERQKNELHDRRVFVKPHFGPEDPDPRLFDDMKR